MRDVIRIFKTLSDPTRLRILLLLLRRDLCVCELMFVLRQEQSRVSHHLRILRDAGLVEDARDGRWINYRIPQEARLSLEPLIKGFLGEEIRLSEAVEQDVARLEVCLKEEVRTRRAVRRRGRQK
jgi:ArsR family transcriptional regulator